MGDDEIFARGLALRRAMFGPGGAEEQIEAATSLTEKLQDVVTRYCYGDIWSRAGLDLRDRSIITMALLVALGRTDELEMHTEGALANGVTAEEIRELLLQSVLYCGLPAAVSGFHAAERVLSVHSVRDVP